MASCIEFGNLKSDIGLAKLNEYLSSHSFITGYNLTQDDNITHKKLLSRPNKNKFPHATRWFNHIEHFHEAVRNTWPKGQIKKETKEEEEDLDLFGDDSSAPVAPPKVVKKDEKKKKEVIAKSSVVLQVNPVDDTIDLDELCKKIKTTVVIPGLTWGEKHAKVPLAFTLYYLQLSCTIIDDQVCTDEIIAKIKCLGLSEEDGEKVRKRMEDAEEDEDDDDELEGQLVSSVTILSFNKI